MLQLHRHVGSGVCDIEALRCSKRSLGAARTRLHLFEVRRYELRLLGWSSGIRAHALVEIRNRQRQSVPIQKPTANLQNVSILCECRYIIGQSRKISASFFRQRLREHVAYASLDFIVTSRSIPLSGALKLDCTERRFRSANFYFEHSQARFSAILSSVFVFGGSHDSYEAHSGELHDAEVRPPKSSNMIPSSVILRCERELSILSLPLLVEPMKKKNMRKTRLQLPLTAPKALFESSEAIARV